MKRASGILMPITSLPSEYGVGTMGKEAYKFIDFLVKSGQTYWQILPISPTGYGNSPYQSVSSYAGNPYWIDFEILTNEGLLKKSDYENIDWGLDKTKVDYEKLYNNRFIVLNKAVNKIINDEEFKNFIKKETYWLYDFSMFMALKEENEEVWFKWPIKIRIREERAMEEAYNRLYSRIMFHAGVQFLFFKQWNKLKSYANNNGIYIIGDLPIYVALDSVDVWCNPEIFDLNDNYIPNLVAGCPPDAFSDDGQLWGNPLYRWDLMAKDNYSWWIKRLSKQIEIYDVLRLDHFRGFESYYAIPYGDNTARNGYWKKGPGINFFECVKNTLGDINIIAEDLGFLTDEAVNMLLESGYPGMKVLLFAFDANSAISDYLPHTYSENCVVYCGTHDNQTINGWMNTAKKEDVEFAKKYLRLKNEEGYHWGMIKEAWKSVGKLTIIQVQDLLGLDNDSRMNTPSTLNNNWIWRLSKDKLDDTLADKINYYMKIYGRMRE